MYVCMYVHTYVETYRHTHTCTCKHTYIYTRTHSTKGSFKPNSITNCTSCAFNHNSLVMYSMSIN